MGTVGNFVGILRVSWLKIFSVFFLILPYSAMPAMAQQLVPAQNNTANNKNVTYVAVPGNIFSSLNKGSPSGVFIQATDLILRQMGKTPNYISIPTGVALQSLEEGKIDVATAVVPLARLRERLWLSDPLLIEYSVPVTLKGKGFSAIRVADLYGKKIGGRTGFQYAAIESDSKIQITRYQTDAEMIRALLFGTVDMALVGAMSDMSGLRTEGVIKRLEVLPVAVGSVPLVAAFSKRLFSDADVQQFNQLLAEHLKSNVWQDILNQNGFADLVREWPLIAQ